MEQVKLSQLVIPQIFVELYDVFKININRSKHNISALPQTAVIDISKKMREVISPTAVILDCLEIQGKKSIIDKGISPIYAQSVRISDTEKLAIIVDDLLNSNDFFFSKFQKLLLLKINFAIIEKPIKLNDISVLIDRETQTVVKLVHSYDFVLKKLRSKYHDLSEQYMSHKGYIYYLHDLKLVAYELKTNEWEMFSRFFAGQISINEFARETPLPRRRLSIITKSIKTNKVDDRATTDPKQSFLNPGAVNTSGNVYQSNINTE